MKNAKGQGRASESVEQLIRTRAAEGLVASVILFTGADGHVTVSARDGVDVPHILTWVLSWWGPESESPGGGPGVGH